MIIYITMFIISIICTYVSTKVNNKYVKILMQILATIPFVVVSAIRYDVGTDYFFRYVPDYNIFVNKGTVASLEPLFVLLIKACILISENYATLFIATSIIINSLIMMTIFKYSKKPVISVIIFFCGGFYFESMNLVRQYIAMAIILCGYKVLLMEKKKFLYLICILIATMFHSMSAFFLIALFFDKKVIKFKWMLVLILLIVVLGGYIGDIVEFVINNTPLKNITNIQKYVKYFKTNGDLHLSTIIVEAVIYAFIYLMYKTTESQNIDKEAKFFVNMQTITILCTVMNIHFELFFRISLLFSMFQILSIPYFWNLNKNKQYTIKKYNIKYMTTVLTVMVLCFMTTRTVFSYIIKRASEILPYKTIFQIEEKQEVK